MNTTMSTPKHSLFYPLLLLSIVCILPTTAYAQQETTQQGKSLEEPIVVAPLDDNSSSEPVAIRLVDALRSNGKQTLSPPQVQALLDRHKSTLNQVDTSRLSQDVELLKEGAQVYFYEGPGAALGRLEKPVNRALSDLPALMARKDLAEQTYEAAVILLRAYVDQGQAAKADAFALKIATVFPSKSPSTKSTPPDIQQLMDKAKAELAKENTALQLKPFKSQRTAQACHYFINGFDASSADSYSVSPSQEYLLQMDCGRGASAIAWKHTPTKDETNAVPIIDVEPLRMTMQDSSFQSRTEIEQRILFILHWTKVKTFIGVSKNGAIGTDQAELLVHVNATNRQALWSDGATQKSLCSTLEDWFPGLQVNCGAEQSKSNKKRSWPLILAATGVATAGAGAALWVINEREIDRIRCSPYAAQGGEPCNDVDAYEVPELDQVDVNELISRTTRKRTLGIGLVSGGALMLLSGVATHFIINKQESSAANNLQLQLAPTQGGAHGSVTFRF